MTAKIKKTNFGKYYITIEAETSLEKMLLTQVADQEKDHGNGFKEFGATIGNITEGDIELSVHNTYTIMVDDPKKEEEPKRKKFLGLF